jgi:hypothetical protein
MSASCPELCASVRYCALLTVGSKKFFAKAGQFFSAASAPQQMLRFRQRRHDGDRGELHRRLLRFSDAALSGPGAMNCPRF